MPFFAVWNELQNCIRVYVSFSLSSPREVGIERLNHGLAGDNKYNTNDMLMLA